MMIIGGHSVTVNVRFHLFSDPIVKYLNITIGIRALRNYPRRIKNFEEARGIRGVGERTARKVVSHLIVSMNVC